MTITTTISGIWCAALLEIEANELQNSDLRKCYGDGEECTGPSGLVHVDPVESQPTET